MKYYLICSLILEIGPKMISTYIAWTHSDMGVVSISGSTAFKHVMAALGHSTVTDTKAFLLTQFSHLIIQYQ